MSIRDGGGDRESVRQCFLFSNHLIITTRTQSGKLHLVDNIGKIPLADVTLIEDPHEEVRANYFPIYTAWKNGNVMILLYE